MIESTAQDYEKYIQVDLKKELTPIEESIDNMLTRLEEFESMVTMVQQESGNLIGLTGTMSNVAEHKSYLDHLCNTIDVLECMVTKVRCTLDTLDNKVSNAEEQFSHLENNTLKNFFRPKLFMKSPEVKSNVTDTNLPTLNVNEYFKPSSDT